MAAPTKYNPDMNQKVIDLMKEGGSIVEVAAMLEVDRQTIYNWINPEHASFQPAFFDTIKRGRLLCQAWWEKQGRENLKEKNFNPTLWMMNMTNRFSDDWKQKQEIKQDIDAKISVEWEEPPTRDS